MRVRFRGHKKVIMRVKKRIIIYFFVAYLREILHLSIVDDRRVLVLCETAFHIVKVISFFMTNPLFSFLMEGPRVVLDPQLPVNVSEFIEDPMFFIRGSWVPEQGWYGVYEHE